MAQFYAYIHGSRGAASRLGTKQSGMTASIKSWSGQIDITLSHYNGTDRAHVSLRPHSGDYGPAVTLYDGPVDGWRTHRNLGPLGRAAWQAENNNLLIEDAPIADAA